MNRKQVPLAEHMTALGSLIWSISHAKRSLELLLESSVRGNVQALFGGEELVLLGD